MNYIEYKFQAYKEEAIHLELKNIEDVKNMNLDRTNSLERYEARKLYIQLHQSLLQLSIKGYFYSYIISILDFEDKTQFQLYEYKLLEDPKIEK